MIYVYFLLILLRYFEAILHKNSDFIATPKKKRVKTTKINFKQDLLQKKHYLWSTEF